MHLARPSRLLWLVAGSLAVQDAFAIPPSTEHVSSCNTDAARWRPAARPKTYLSTLTARVIDWAWDYLHPDAEPQPRLAKPAQRGPSRQLLAKYGDQVVLRFSIQSPIEARSLAEASETLFLDVWGAGSDWIDVRVSKDVVRSLLGLLPASMQKSHRAIMQGNELAQAIANTYPEGSFSGLGSRWSTDSSHQKPSLHTNDVFFDEYQPLGVIENWMLLLQSLFPTHVTKISVGTTHEGREIPALRVGATNPESDQPRRTIIVSGGSHAREWISVSTVNYIAYAFITRYGRLQTADVLDDLDIVFVPTINPDGYIYSFDHDRLWRKNRQPTALEFCPGVDLDRCWNFKWDGERTIDNPCSESFAGENPFEGIEAKSFSQWARNETAEGKSSFVGFIDLHSYSQEILYPYSYTCDEIPPTLEDLEELGQGIAKAIHWESRESYKVMSACEGNVAAMGRVSPLHEGGGGSALDWFYHELGIRKSFQIKLRDKGAYGFLLPREYIVPTGQEILNGLDWFVVELAKSSSMEAAPQMQAQKPLQS